MKQPLFITGISGLLGLNTALALRDRFAVSGCYGEHPVNIEGAQAYGVDLRREDQLRAVLAEVRPAVILHAAGMVNVDACEQDPLSAEEHNVGVSRIIAEIASEFAIKLVHVSTDHLFDGSRPCVTEEEPLRPLNVYGRTKAKAESVVQLACPEALLIRTNFYGWGSPLKASFSDWILSGLEDGRRLRMFTDVYVSPIFINDLIEVIVELLGRGARGIYHVAGRERISKYDFAVSLTSVFGYSRGALEASTIATHPLLARRPHDMSLSVAKVSSELNSKMPGVRDGLEHLKRLGEIGWRAQLDQAAAITNPHV